MKLSDLLARAHADDIRLEVEDGQLVLDSPEELSARFLTLFRRHKAALLDYFSRPPRIYLDFETASRLDLRQVGATAYAAHPSTRVLLLCYAIGNEPVQTWRDGPIPGDLATALSAGATVVAHNYQFDLAIWQAHQVPQGWPDLPWQRWSCTAARARHARLPASLDGLAKVLKLEQQKDNAGRLLMLKLAKTAFRGGVEPAPEQLDRLATYCVRDVDALREADRRVPMLPEDAQAIAALDYAMNQRGMPGDLDLVRQLIVVRDAEDRRLKQEIASLTDGAITSPTQCQRIHALLAGHGVTLPDLTADTLEAWDDANAARDDLAARVIRIRREFAHEAGKKLTTILAAADTTSLVRDGFVFFGAHTGRWSGRGVQLQNLPRNTLEDPEATLARLAAAATSKDPTKVQDDSSADAKLSIKAQLAGVIRGLFQAPPGQVFVVADLAQIEPRVLCWLAGQQDKLAAYADPAGDVYTLTAAALGSDDRQLGKLLDISAGYGASWRVPLHRAKGFGIALSEDDARAHIDRWRQANPNIVSFWSALHQACRQVVEWPLDAGAVSVGALTLWRTRGALRVKLPSGRDLVYRNPRLEPQADFPERLELVVDLPRGSKLLPVRLWHGAAIENVVQAIACDVLTHAMLQLERDGVPIVATVHDEIVAVVPAAEGEATLKRMREVLSAPLVWAPGLPLAAEGYVNRRYLKPKEPEHAEQRAERLAGADARAASPGGGHRTHDVDAGTPEGLATTGPRNRDAALATGIPIYEAKNGTRLPGIHNGVEILAERLVAILGVEQVEPSRAAALIAELNTFRRLVADHARHEAQT